MRTSTIFAMICLAVGIAPSFGLRSRCPRADPNETNEVKKEEEALPHPSTPEPWFDGPMRASPEPEGEGEEGSNGRVTHHQRIHTGQEPASSTAHVPVTGRTPRLGHPHPSRDRDTTLTLQAQNVNVRTARLRPPAPAQTKPLTPLPYHVVVGDASARQPGTTFGSSRRSGIKGGNRNQSEDPRLKRKDKL